MCPGEMFCSEVDFPGDGQVSHRLEMQNCQRWWSDIVYSLMEAVDGEAVFCTSFAVMLIHVFVMCGGYLCVMPSTYGQGLQVQVF